MLLHYELIFANYKLVNVHNRRSSMLPVSFMVLCDEDGNSPYNDPAALRSILDELLTEYPEVISPIIKERGTKQYNSDDIALMNEIVLFNRTESASEFDSQTNSYVIHSSIQNMVIELYNPETKTRRFAFSNSIDWNIIAMNLAMANDIGMNFESENSLRYFTSDIFTWNTEDTKKKIEQYTYVASMGVFDVDNDVEYNMRMDISNLNWRDRNAVKEKAAYMLCKKYQIIGSEYSFTKDILETVSHGSSDTDMLLIASEDYEQMKMPFGLSRVPLMKLMLGTDKRHELVVRYMYSNCRKMLWRSIKPIEYSSTIEYPKSADILYKIFS